MEFKGIYVAIVTPFSDDGRIDHDALAALSSDLVDQGIHGLVPCGTTGESATLSHDEHRQVVETVVGAVGGRVPVVAGTGSNSTAEAIRLTNDAADAGADGALLISPYYNRPTQAGLFAHFETIASETDLPLILYNIPSRTAVDIKPDTIGRLARLDRIVGLKEATGSITVATDIISRCGPEFLLFSGDDGMTLPMLAIGGHGVISVVAQLAPALMVQLYEAFIAGDLDTARQINGRLMPLINALFIETNPGPIKEAMYYAGAIPRPDLRLPLVRVDLPTRALLRSAMAQAGIDVVNGR